MFGGQTLVPIHLAAGTEMFREIVRIKRNYVGDVPVGETVVTKGYDLPAKHVFHTVGPRGTKILELAACYYSCMRECVMVCEKCVG